MLRRFIIVLSILSGVFMMLDGLAALATGSYIAPGGQIGPWVAVLRAVGISAFSSGVKVAFVVLGAAYVVSAVAFAFYRPYSRLYLGAIALLTLWYVPIGSFISLIVLVYVARVRSGIR
jgi:hypothetical protein